MCLFDEIVRNDFGARDLTEPKFSFLNRSARSGVQYIRDLLERWFAKFPDAGKNDLRRRFRSDDSRQHLGAFFELYCHALLYYQGFKVETHPSIPEKSTQPDFLVKKDDEPLFYMESKVVEESDGVYADDKRESQLINYLDKHLNSPNYFIFPKIYNLGPGRLSYSRMRSSLEKHLQKLDPNLDAPSLLPWSNKGWEIDFYLLPKSKETHSNQGTQPIGVIHPSQAIDPPKTILNALKSKAGKYGTLDHPYVIALNIIRDIPEWHEVIKALFGQEHFPGIAQPQDGFWLTSQGPRNKRVSAVLIIIDLDPWTIAQSLPVLFHSPRANHPLDLELWQGLQLWLVSDLQRLNKRKGKEAYEILGLNPT